MSEFGRLLTAQQLNGLQAELQRTPDGVVADLLRLWVPNGLPTPEDGGLRLALRREYFNLYVQGQSLARVAFDSQSRPIVSLHPKYVLQRPSTEKGDDVEPHYVRIQDGRIEGKHPGLPSHYCGHEMLRAWMKTAQTYAGAEKKFVDRLLRVNGAVIDLEMALPALPGEKSAPRMDIVALEKNAGRTRIVFWEAKCMGNSDLRARAEPFAEKGAEIFPQLKKYEDWVSDFHRNRLVGEAYANTARILVELHRIREALTGRALPPGELVQEVATASEPPPLIERPRVIIEDGVERGSFPLHRKRLEDRGYFVQVVKDEDPFPTLRAHA